MLESRVRLVVALLLITVFVLLVALDHRRAGAASRGADTKCRSDTNRSGQDPHRRADVDGNGPSIPEPDRKSDAEPKSRHGGLGHAELPGSAFHARRDNSRQHLDDARGGIYQDLARGEQRDVRHGSPDSRSS